MDVNSYKIEDIVNKVLQLDEDIKMSKLTVSDSNVLSVAMGKLISDMDKMNSIVAASKENVYEDMIDYYGRSLEKSYFNLLKSYNIVTNLFSIAEDKDRESLLMYLR